MKRLSFVPVGLLAFVACSHGGMKPVANSEGLTPAPSAQRTADEAYRAAQPHPLDVPPHFEAPIPVQQRLSNGIPVLIRENHALPLVVVEVLVKTGVQDDPSQAAGLSEFVAGMLPEGTRTRSAMEIATKLEDLAASLSAVSGLESSRIHLNCLTETLGDALDVLADVTQNPAFRDEDTERMRGLKLTGLEQKKGYPPAVAADQMARSLYGDTHPWGQPAGGTPKSVKAIRRADLARFHKTYYVANNAQIVVSGDVTPETVLPLLEARFKGWSNGRVPQAKLPPFPSMKSGRLTLVNRAAATQSQVWLGTRIFPATSPDAVPMFVANNVLGGLFTSRLNLNLREEKGYSYGVHSQVSLNRATGAFIAAGGIFADKTALATGEFVKELRGFGEVSEAELASAKSAIIGSLPSVLETNDAVAGALNSLTTKGLPLDYYATLAGKVTSVTRADVRRIATSYVAPTAWQVVVVGPLKTSEAELRKLELGKTEVVP